MPTLLGLGLDPKERATLKSVAAKSAAEKAGFRAGDNILQLDGQPIISIADVQWVLQQTKEPGQVGALVERGSKQIELTLSLAKGWRRRADFAWRDSTCGWAIVRFNSADLSDAERKRLGFAEETLALAVDFVGIEIKDAGLKKKDIILQVDGQRKRMTESDFLAYVVRHKSPGEKLDLSVLRAGKEMNLTVPVQDIR
jgi:S1-C subfamily serine protease